MTARSRALAVLVAMGVLQAGLPWLAESTDAYSVGFVTRIYSWGSEWTAAAWNGQSLYVFGGTSPDDQGRDTIWRYDPVAGTLTTMGARLPTPRYGMSAVWDGRYIQLFGGKTAAGYFGEILRYDPATDTIANTGSVLPTERYATAAVWDGSTHAYIFGGWGRIDTTGTQGCTSGIVRYTPSTNTVTQMNGAFPGMSGAAAVWVDGRAYIFGPGACDGTTTGAEIWKYEPAADKVTVSGTGMPSVAGGRAAVTDGRFVYVFFRPKPVRYEPATGNLVTLSVEGFTTYSAGWDGKAAYFVDIETRILRLGTEPGRPLGLVASTGPDAGQITLRWNPPDSSTYPPNSPVSEYRIYRSISSGGPFTKVGEASGSVTSSVDTVGLNGVTRYYKVSAVNPGGESPLSDEASAVTDSPPVAVIAPVAPAECVAGRGEVQLDGSGSSDPDGDALTYRWAGGTITAPTAPKTDGSFPLATSQVRLTVDDGLLSHTASADVLVQDTLAPTTRPDPTGTAGDNGWWRSDVALDLVAEDLCGTATTSFASVDGAAFQAGTRHAVRGDAEHAVRFHSEDALGHSEPPKLISVNIDTIPPETTGATSCALPGSNGWCRTDVEVVLAPTDATSKVASTSFSLNGEPFQVGTSLTATEDLEHTLRFFSRDRAGNVETTKSLSFKKDATPPSTTHTLAGTEGWDGWWVSDVTVTLAADDATSGVAGSFIAVDDGDFQAGTSALVTGDKVHTLRYYSRDNAGNDELVKTVTLRIDATPPEVGIENPANGTVHAFDLKLSGDARLPVTVVVGPKTVAASAVDATSGVHHVEFLVAGGQRASDASAPYGFLWDGGSEALGSRALQALAYDAAGNSRLVALEVLTVPHTPAGVQRTVADVQDRVQGLPDAVPECGQVAAPEACAALAEVLARAGSVTPPGEQELYPLCRQVLSKPVCDGLFNTLGAEVQATALA